jgi:hypothetical protein
MVVAIVSYGISADYNINKQLAATQSVVKKTELDSCIYRKKHLSALLCNIVSNPNLKMVRKLAVFYLTTEYFKNFVFHQTKYSLLLDLYRMLKLQPVAVQQDQYLLFQQFQYWAMY